MATEELIASRVNASKQDMRLTSYKGDGVYKIDVTVAKNYLREDEIKELNQRSTAVWNRMKVGDLILSGSKL